MPKQFEFSDITFSKDENDPEDIGSWRIRWAGYNITLSTEYAAADKPYFMIDRIGGDDDETAIFYPDGKIELGAFDDCRTSFVDLIKCLAIRNAVRLLNRVK